MYLRPPKAHVELGVPVAVPQSVFHCTVEHIEHCLVPLVAEKYRGLQCVLVKAVGVVADARDGLCPRARLNVDVLADEAELIACPVDALHRPVQPRPPFAIN